MASHPSSVLPRCVASSKPIHLSVTHVPECQQQDLPPRITGTTKGLQTRRALGAALGTQYVPLSQVPIFLTIGLPYLTEPVLSHSINTQPMKGPIPSRHALVPTVYGGQVSCPHRQSNFEWYKINALFRTSLADSACQYRGHGSIPGPGSKVPQAVKPLIPCNTTTELVL